MKNRITAEEAQRWRDKLAGIRDPENFHWSEDKLHRNVLLAVADGSPESVTLAKIALSTSHIKTIRWYA